MPPSCRQRPAGSLFLHALGDNVIVAGAVDADRADQHDDRLQISQASDQLALVAGSAHVLSIDQSDGEGWHMVRARVRRGTALFVLMALLASIGIAGAWAQGADDLGNLGQQVARLRGEGKFAQAMEVAKRASSPR